MMLFRANNSNKHAARLRLPMLNKSNCTGLNARCMVFVVYGQYEPYIPRDEHGLNKRAGLLKLFGFSLY